MARHRPLTFFLIVSTAVVLVVAIIFSILASTNAGKDNLFKYGVGRSDSRKYPSDIEPANWTFRIWIFIFIFQVAWVIYAHTLLCRKNSTNKEFMYYSPPFLPPSFYAIYILALILAIVWLFAFDNDYVTASFVSLLATSMCLEICLFFSFYYLWEYENQISVAEMWVNIILVQNGIGLFSSWTVIATLLNLNSVLTTDTTTVSKEDAGTLCLSLLLAIVLIHSCIDIFLFTKRLRYYIAPYIVLVVAMSGIVDETWDSQKRNSNFAVAILSIVVIVGMAKLVAMTYRIIMDPLRIEKKCGNL